MESYSSEKVTSQRSCLLLCLAWHHIQGQIPLPRCIHRKLQTSYLDLSLTKMPFVTTFPEKPQWCIPIVFHPPIVYASLLPKKKKKKKKKSSELMVLPGHACCNSAFSLFGFAFCKKGYSSHGRISIMLSVFFFSNCSPKEWKSFNINSIFIIPR